MMETHKLRKMWCLLMLETKKDVMPLVVSDENLQTQESMVIVFDSGGKWALMNLTGLVDWLIRNI